MDVVTRLIVTTSTDGFYFLALDDDGDQLYWSSEWLSLLGRSRLECWVEVFSSISSLVLIDVLTFECVEVY